MQRATILMNWLTLA